MRYLLSSEFLQLAQQRTGKGHVDFDGLLVIFSIVGIYEYILFIYHISFYTAGTQ